MELDFLDAPKDRSYFEVVFKCPRCKETFFGTFYRDEKQALNDTECLECKEKKDALRPNEGTKASNRLLQPRPLTKTL